MRCIRSILVTLSPIRKRQQVNTTTSSELDRLARRCRGRLHIVLKAIAWPFAKQAVFGFCNAAVFGDRFRKARSTIKISPCIGNYHI